MIPYNHLLFIKLIKILIFKKYAICYINIAFQLLYWVVIVKVVKSSSVKNNTGPNGATFHIHTI